MPDDRTNDRADDQGGEEVCWLSRVCDACGRLTEGRAARTCAACGEPLDG